MAFQVKVLKELKTYSRSSKSSKSKTNTVQSENEFEPLTSKEAARLLLNGTLRLRVCRYCLNQTSYLSELDEIMVIAGKSGLYEVTIKDIIASFHPFQVAYDSNFPNKICKKCLDQALACYLFAQQCEQSERALRNYIEDMDEKFDKLDPIEPVKKRGKRKLNPNHNILYAEHLNVIDYAEPIINLVNLNALPIESREENDLECSKCWQVLPDKTSLINHEKAHPKSMWYNCRQCGKSFVKYTQLKKHKRLAHTKNSEMEIEDDAGFSCRQCGVRNKEMEQHLLHIEKHKFQQSLDNLINGNTSKMCSVCYGEENDMVELKETMHLHGGLPGLTGPKSIYNMISSVFPDITLPCYTGTKICKHCLSKLVTTYIFTFTVKNIWNRLNKCISSMISDLNNIEDDKNVIIEISQDAIMPLLDLQTNDLSKDEFDMQIDVLEDEFRITSETESESINSDLENPAKNATKTYGKKNIVNGFQHYIKCEYLDDVCSEFLTFKRPKKNKRRKLYRYTCPVCYKHFISDYFLKKHVLKHRATKVECKQCPRTFKSKFHLYEHVKMEHLLKLVSFIECCICGRNFKDNMKLKKHIKKHFKIQCHLCDKYFKKQENFDVHMQRHAIKLKRWRRNDVLTCSFCEKPCVNENSLSLHVNKVHLLMKPYNCDMCEKQFYTEYNLNCHKLVHRMFSQEECEFCHKVFKCRKNLVIHLRKHINIRPHFCPVCPQTFYSESSMKRHMKRYHGGRYCCRLCRTVVDSNTDLKDHIKVAHSCM